MTTSSALHSVCTSAVDRERDELQMQQAVKRYMCAPTSATAQFVLYPALLEIHTAHKLFLSLRMSSVEVLW